MSRPSGALEGRAGAHTTPDSATGGPAAVVGGHPIWPPLSPIWPTHAPKAAVGGPYAPWGCPWCIQGHGVPSGGQEVAWGGPCEFHVPLPCALGLKLNKKFVDHTQFFPGWRSDEWPSGLLHGSTART